MIEDRFSRSVKDASQLRCLAGLRCRRYLNAQIHLRKTGPGTLRKRTGLQPVLHGRRQADNEKIQNCYLKGRQGRRQFLKA